MSWRSEYQSRRLERVLEETKDLHPRLGEWLYAATDGVGVLGRRRIIADITAHYEKAHADASGRGLDGDAAHAEALESLGDAKAARKKFRRKYLSVGAERNILTTFDLIPWLMAIFCLSGTMMVFAAFASRDAVEWTAFGLGVYYLGLCSLWVLFRRWREAGNFRYTQILLVTLICFHNVPYTFGLSQPLWLTLVWVSGFVLYLAYVVYIMVSKPKQYTEEEMTLLLEEHPDTWEATRRRIGR